MSKHKMTAWCPFGLEPDALEVLIEYTFSPGRPAVMYLRNGDPGHPGWDAEVEVVSIKPGAGNHGVFTDIADRMLLDEAQDWLDNEGHDAALEIAAEDHEADREEARERAAEMRADR